MGATEQRGGVVMKCCELTAGQLRVPVQILEKTRVPDGVGGSTETLNVVASTRAKWRHASMGERLQAQAVQASVMHRVYLRYNANIRPDMILRDDEGVDYNIRGVADIEKRKRWLELSIEEGVAT